MYLVYVTSNAFNFTCVIYYILYVICWARPPRGGGAHRLHHGRSGPISQNVSVKSFSQESIPARICGVT